MRSDLPIAIVGAGFSGTLLAVNLLRLGQRVVLIERDAAKLAKGQAFGTRRPEHLLNVRAANMSAYPDDPDHFIRWMGFSTAEQVNRFVPRLAYGQYLLDQLTDALARNGDRAEIRAGEVTAARFGKASTRLQLAGGAELECRVVVLALGNLPSAPIPALAELPDDMIVPYPWEGNALAGLKNGHVLLVGTGLTAVDVTLSLERMGFTGRITALSRRGLRPRPHAEAGPPAAPIGRPQARGSRLLNGIRRRAAKVGWREAIDELRPHTQGLWRMHSPEEQNRFLRHARPYWDVHRHRLAPAVDRTIAALEQAGRLRFAAGKVLEAVPDSGRMSVSFRPRGTDRIERLTVDGIVNCTGPDGNLLRLTNALIGGLLAQGRIRPDVHRLGLDVDHAGRARDASGFPQDRLFAVGPITKGEAWEVVAVPDIRRQVWDLARFLANEHWVGGEGL